MVQMYSESAGDYFDTGLSSRSVYARGDGVPGNFGFADCGLFELDDPSLAARGASAQTASTVGEAESLLGKMLQGESALLVDGYPGAQRSAEVIGVHARIDREMFDLVLRVDAPGTYAGDSGMLWKTAQGDAAAIHLRGERTPNGSRTTIAMLASRAENLLDVVLAYG